MTQAETAGEYPLVGQTIASKYKIVRLLGEGGMGCVYLGEQMLGTTVRKVAVKTLHNHLSHDASIKARFQREVGTVAALEHPNTIQVFDFGSMDDGTLYIVMEYVSGRSVADVLEKDGAMPPPRVSAILKQVVGSLEEAHNHEIVHRDLKPDNVLLSERAGQKDWVEVLDFGIAKRSNEHDPNEAKLTQQGMVLGTPPYMSPEQFTGQPIDLRTDIYALGVMAYEMLSGRLPWEANTAWEWASKHMTEEPTPLERQPLGPNVPESMRSAIARALSKDKNGRFGSVREFYDAFAADAPPSSMAYPPAGTKVISTPPGGPPVSGRAKTEMGAPMMAGPVSNSSPGSFSPAQPSIAAVPPPPPAEGKKSGPPTLVYALGGLAALLIVGAIVTTVMSKKPAAVVTPPIDLSASSSATTVASTIATENVSATPVASATPLDTKPGHTTTTSGGAPHPTKPVPTPVPSKEEPLSCKRLKNARTHHDPPSIIKSLEQECRASGGTP
jgi:serine/threonine-protein kinase